MEPAPDCARSAARSGPLAGIRVLEVANWLAAPAAAALLADLGAAVIKVEPPRGDTWRYYRGTHTQPGAMPPPNPGFQLDNRGKRSTAINLDHTEGRAAVLRMAAEADIFITNLVPRRLARYGLRYEDLSKDHPRLIYAGLSAYGAKGEERDRLGFDFNAFWARSGIMSLVGDRDGPPAMPRSGMGDHATTLAIAWAIMVALYERERTGEGQELQASLLNTGLWVLGSDVQTALMGMPPAPKHARVAPRNPIANDYCTKDGRWILIQGNQPERDWPRVCAALGLEHLRDDPRFRTTPERQKHSAELVVLLDAAIAQRTRAEWGPILDQHGLIWAPAQDLSEAIEDPQARANGYFVEVEHPSLGRFRTIDTPIRFGKTEAGARGAAPELGQHTEEVLLEYGYGWEDIVRLRDEGAIG
jgi:crotonobetainyl-CoA:carnitine CoA-transferase CaiB-like acyl-CoA transferase